MPGDLTGAQRRALWWTGSLLVALTALSLGPAQLMVCVALASLSLLVTVAGAWWMMTPLPHWPGQLAGALAVGGVVVAVALEALTGSAQLAGRGASAEMFDAAVVAPVVEEAVKLTCALWLLRRGVLRGVSALDGAVAGVLVGAGFAFTENVFYYGLALSSGPYELLATFTGRGVMSFWAHPLFTGAAVALCVRAGAHRRDVRRRWAALLCALAVGVALHAAWNGALTAGLTVEPMVGEGLLALVGAGWMLRARARRARRVRNRVRGWVGVGLLSDADGERMLIGRRRRAFWADLAADGPAALQAGRAELALLALMAERRAEPTLVDAFERVRARRRLAGLLVRPEDPAAAL